MIEIISAKFKDYWSHIRWLQRAWTIDLIDSPLLADFYHRVIIGSQQLDLPSEDRLLIELCYFFEAKHIAIYKPQEIRTELIQGLSPVVSNVSFVQDSFTEVEGLDLVISMSDILHTIPKVKLPLIMYREAVISDALSSNYNVTIDLWYYRVYWYDGRIKEEINIALSPYRRRWKLGISRPLAGS